MSLITNLHKRLKDAKEFDIIDIEEQEKRLYQYAAKLKSRGNPLSKELLEHRKSNFLAVGSVGIKISDANVVIYLAQHNFLSSVFHHSEIPATIKKLGIKPFIPTKRLKFFPLHEALKIFLYGKTRKIKPDPPRILDENLIRDYLGVYHLQFLELFEELCDESCILRYF